MAARAPVADGLVVEVRGLHTRLGSQVIHSGVDLEVHRGELVSVIGASGAGKTVLLDQIIGLRRPARGTIRVLGAEIGALDPIAARLLRRRWGVLFQQAALFSALSVYDNLAFPLRELRKQGVRVAEDMVRESVALKLHMVGLAPADAWKFPFELSGGMAKRAALARALMLEAELLFLDEPTSGLDPAAASDFDRLLGELHAELGFSALMITHDIYSVATLSDRVVVLADGRLAATGALEDVARLQHPFIASFFRARQGEDRLRALPTYAGA